MSTQLHTTAPLRTYPGGDANVQMLANDRSGRWHARILFNGELMDARQEAYARLFAVAPELLDALAELADAGAEAWGEDRPCVKAARAVIAKATGSAA